MGSICIVCDGTGGIEGEYPFARCKGCGERVWIRTRTPCAPISAMAVRVLDLLTHGRFNLSTEAATQNDVDAMFAVELDGRFVREKHLGPGDRPDFLVAGGIVVEVKRFRRTTPAQVLRQLERYAAYPEVTELVLATGHAMGLPRVIGGKPLHVVNVGRGWL